MAKNNETKATTNEYKEIQVQFARGCVDHVFEGKDGTQYAQIVIPNKDPEDKTPWESFVAPADKVYEGKSENSLYVMLPENGSTTVRKPEIIGQDENGKNLWGNSERKVPNTELKEMVEHYKQRETFKHKIANLSDKVQKREANREKPAAKAKDMAI